MEWDSGFVFISTVTFQKAGIPSSNKSLPKYFWRHCGGAGLHGWRGYFLVWGIVFSYKTSVQFVSQHLVSKDR